MPSKAASAKKRKEAQAFPTHKPRLGKKPRSSTTNIALKTKPIIVPDTRKQYGPYSTQLPAALARIRDPLPRKRRDGYLKLRQLLTPVPNEEIVRDLLLGLNPCLACLLDGDGDVRKTGISLLQVLLKSLKPLDLENCSGSVIGHVKGAITHMSKDVRFDCIQFLGHFPSTLVKHLGKCTKELGILLQGYDHYGGDSRFLEPMLRILADVLNPSDDVSAYSDIPEERKGLKSFKLGETIHIPFEATRLTDCRWHSNIRPGHILPLFQESGKTTSTETIDFHDELRKFIDERWGETMQWQEDGAQRAQSILQCLRGLLKSILCNVEPYPQHSLEKILRTALTILTFFPFEMAGSARQRQAWGRCNSVCVELVSIIASNPDIKVKGFGEYSDDVFKFLSKAMALPDFGGFPLGPSLQRIVQSNAIVKTEMLSLILDACVEDKVTGPIRAKILASIAARLQLGTPACRLFHSRVTELLFAVTDDDTVTSILIEALHKCLLSSLPSDELKSQIWKHIPDLVLFERGGTCMNGPLVAWGDPLQERFIHVCLGCARVDGHRRSEPRHRDADSENRNSGIAKVVKGLWLCFDADRIQRSLLLLVLTSLKCKAERNRECMAIWLDLVLDIVMQTDPNTPNAWFRRRELQESLRNHLLHQALARPEDLLTLSLKSMKNPHSMSMLQYCGLVDILLLCGPSGQTEAEDFLVEHSPLRFHIWGESDVGEERLNGLLRPLARALARNKRFDKKMLWAWPKGVLCRWNTLRILRVLGANTIPGHVLASISGDGVTQVEKFAKDLVWKTRQDDEIGLTAFAGMLAACPG